MTIAQTIGRVNAGLEVATRSREFAEYARALMMAEGSREAALRYAGASRRVVDALKADIAGDTTSSADALAPYRNLSEGFTATLSNSAFDAVLADANIAPLHTQFAVVTSDASAAVAGEGLAKKVSSVSLNGSTLQERRAAVIVAVSDDLLRFNTAVGLLENSLRTGVAAATDSIFLAAMVALTTPVASTGDIFKDLRTALAAAGSGANSKFHLVVGAATAQQLAFASTTTGAPVFAGMTPSGGMLNGVAVHVSDYFTDSALVIDASALVASADAVAIRVSQNASLEMDDAPAQAIAAGSPPAPVAASGKVVSMFQTNSTAILAERVFGFSLLRASAAQSISGVTWGLTGSPAA